MSKRFSDSNVSFLIVRGKSNDSFSQVGAPAMGTEEPATKGRYGVPKIDAGLTIIALGQFEMVAGF